MFANPHPEAIYDDKSQQVATKIKKIIAKILLQINRILSL
ncbi:hypothetical protein VCRA2116O29_640020 [Vibrio crassostreae]|nr:hypothetical protein VCRA2116O29_640020 [Vibrio crassostreae]CAK2533608.1 hypothetical protein VCRA2119O48_630021 [Vibrio crassostreae]CAK2925910.1 hypothetical protein VCRA2133E348_30002 [Vibrio crassostreae]CAK3047378.1 hypothetical protein VCRA2120E331_40201 [Vibrio crassostreae]CAK3487760.1 hypothetical protein VCRA213O314_40003 [Vibrio crassostreae]